MFAEMIIKNGVIINGKNEPGFKGDLRIRDGRIATIAENIEIPDGFPENAVIQADGAYVTPGFIDIHRHGDWKALTRGDDELLNRQGITTVVNGNCGLSSAPAGEGYRDQIHRFLRSVIGDIPEMECESFENAPSGGTKDPSDMAADFASYMKMLRDTSRSVNTGMLVGNGTLRAAAAGYSGEPLSDPEIEEIRMRLDEALRAGAYGLSIGLAYAPEFAYTKEELIRVLAPFRGKGFPLIAHIRNEGDGLYESVREMIDISKALELPLHISHMKCIGRRNWQRLSRNVLETIKEERKAGMKIDYDLYPYITGSTQLVHLLPPKYLKGGTEAIVTRLSNPSVRKEITQCLMLPSLEYENIVELAGFENIYLPSLRAGAFSSKEGLSIQKIAEEMKRDPYDILYDVLIAEECGAPMLDTFGSEEDLLMYYQDPEASVISDAIYPSGGKLHPRVYQAFPKFLIDFVRERKIFTIEEAVSRMTSKPARVLGLNRGSIEVGMPADLNVFRLKDLSVDNDFSNPGMASGLMLSMVNGCVTVRKDQWNMTGSGKILRAKR